MNASGMTLAAPNFEFLLMHVNNTGLTSKHNYYTFTPKNIDLNCAPSARVACFQLSDLSCKRFFHDKDSRNNQNGDSFSTARGKSENRKR